MGVPFIDCHNISQEEYETILELTGVFGVEKTVYRDQMTDFLCDKERKVVEVTLSTEQFKTLSVKIDFKNGYIQNRLVISNRKRSNLSPYLLYAQVYAARELKFKHLSVYAFGNATKEDCNGYLVWGKVGYQLEPKFQRQFLALMKSLGRDENYLHELLKTKNGTKVWRKHGFEWEGKFMLHGNAKSYGILHELLASHGESGFNLF